VNVFVGAESFGTYTGDLLFALNFTSTPSSSSARRSFRAVLRLMLYFWCTLKGVRYFSRFMSRFALSTSSFGRLTSYSACWTMLLPFVCLPVSFFFFAISYVTAVWIVCSGFLTLLVMVVSGEGGL